MGKILKQFKVAGLIGEDYRFVLFDSGASASLIRKDVAEKIARIDKKLVKRIFTLADGETTIESDSYCVIDIVIDGKYLDGLFYVVDKLAREIIVGVDFMQKWEIKLDLKKEEIIVGIDPNNIEIT